MEFAWFVLLGELVRVAADVTVAGFDARVLGSGDVCSDAGCVGVAESSVGFELKGILAGLDISGGSGLRAVEQAG